VGVEAFMVLKIQVVFSEDGGSKVLQNIGFQSHHQRHNPEYLT